MRDDAKGNDYASLNTEKNEKRPKFLLEWSSRDHSARKHRCRVAGPTAASFPQSVTAWDFKPGGTQP